MQWNAISQKLLRVALRTVFCVVSPSLLVVNRSPRLYFWLQKSSITCAVTSTVTAEFKVQSNGTCAYIRSIRNYGILNLLLPRAARTEQYPATLHVEIFVVKITHDTRHAILFSRADNHGGSSSAKSIQYYGIKFQIASNAQPPLT